MTLGTGTSLPVVMSPSELAKLVGVIYFDTGKSAELEKDHPGLWARINPQREYYSVALDWFTTQIELKEGQHVRLLQSSAAQIADFATYLRCLSELHKRRRKYAMILAAQPMPTMVQVSPRALMEFGQINSEALASWLTWRKFFYDLDNRSAQETGYLFEPILAAAIGGEPKNAKAKVVHRASDPAKGRQVDCWKVLPDGTRLAYEFKLRVTIAASGQGRFAEELQFAEDCEVSKVKPVLIVLDPTMNPRLSELQEAYKSKGGSAYLGDDAWKHLEDEAGETMARFIEQYVRKPVAEISKFETPASQDGGKRQFALLDLEAKCRAGEIVLSLGKHQRRIARHEDASLADQNDKSEVE